MLKVAVAGIGGISGAHIPVWISMKDVELVALCDIRLSQMEKYTDFKTYQDFDEMLEKEEIDILDICLPTYLHADFSIKAMNKGINVICEKPISLNREDVKRVYDCAEKNHVKFMVAQVLRFWDEYKFAKEIYDSKKYGKLLSGSFYRLGARPKWSWDSWMTDEKRSGLVPFDLHIHDLDYIYYVFGEPKKVHSHRAKTPEQDYINAVYEYDDFFLTTEASWYAAPYPFSAGFRLQFENAVVAHEGVLTVYEKDGETYQPFAGIESTNGKVINLPATDAYGNEIRYFADCVKNDKPIDILNPHELESVIDTLKNL